jgi:hypothetical protein
MFFIKFRNITCQSGVDLILNKNKANRGGKNNRHNQGFDNVNDMETQENNEMDDRNFIDMVTSK